MKTKLRKTYNYLIRAAIILISYGFIYYELFYKRDLNELLQVFYDQWQTDFFFVVLALVIVLIFVNSCDEVIFTLNILANPLSSMVGII